MWRLQTPAQPQADVLTLEDHVTRAGFALACSYSSSDEYEAELIAARRAAGVYGPKRHQRHVRFAAVVAGLAVVVMVIMLVA
jgi:hypothetical protein